jgi:hypothetical protein
LRPRKARTDPKNGVPRGLGISLSAVPALLFADLQMRGKRQRVIGQHASLGAQCGDQRFADPLAKAQATLRQVLGDDTRQCRADMEEQPAV